MVAPFLLERADHRISVRVPVSDDSNRAVVRWSKGNAVQTLVNTAAAKDIKD